MSTTQSTTTTTTTNLTSSSVCDYGSYYYEKYQGEKKKEYEKMTRLVESLELLVQKIENWDDFVNIFSNESSRKLFLTVAYALEIIGTDEKIQLEKRLNNALINNSKLINSKSFNFTDELITC